MAFKSRSDLVGKRFLCVYANHCSDHLSPVSKPTNQSPSSQTHRQPHFKPNKDCTDKCFNGLHKLKATKIQDWPWKAGIIRASSHHDSHNQDLAILVEFDERNWDKREWIKVYEPDRFQIFLIEHTLIWCCRKVSTLGNNINWPALNFEPYVDKIGLKADQLKPVEYLDDQKLDFRHYGELRKYDELSLNEEKSTVESCELRSFVNKWTDYQKQQHFLTQTPSILTGYRVQCYRAAGNSTTQWFTAVIKSYLESTKELLLTDDTVLEEHCEDPTLIQMNLIGDGVIDSILKGGNASIVPRRRACTQNITSTTYNISSRRTNLSSNPSTSSMNSVNSPQLNQNSSNLNNSKTASPVNTPSNSNVSSLNKFPPQPSDKTSSFKSTNNSSPKHPFCNNSSGTSNHFLNSSSSPPSTNIMNNMNNRISGNVPNSKDVDCLSNNDPTGTKKSKREKFDKLDSSDLKDKPTDLSQPKKNSITSGYSPSNWPMSNNSNLNSCTGSKKVDKPNLIGVNSKAKSNQIEQQTHFRPAPMLKQVAKTKAPSYITQPMNSKPVHSHLQPSSSTNNNKFNNNTNSVHTSKSKQLVNNNSISNLQVNNNLVNLNSSTLDHNSSTAINQQTPINYSTTVPFMPLISNHVVNLSSIPAHSSNNSINSSLITSTINSVVNMSQQQLDQAVGSQMTNNKTESKNSKSTKGTKGRPLKNQPAQQQASNLSSTHSALNNPTSNASLQFNPHQMSMINQAQQWTPNLSNSMHQFSNDLQKHMACQQLTKIQQSTTSSSNNNHNQKPRTNSTAEQMNKMKMQASYSTALLNSNVNMNHQLSGLIYDQQTNTLNKSIDYATLLNGSHHQHQPMNGLLNTQQQPQHSNQVTLSMFGTNMNSGSNLGANLQMKNQMDMMKLASNPEQSKLLMAEIEKYQRQQMGTQQPYVPNLNNIPTTIANKAYLNPKIQINSMNPSHPPFNPQLLNYQMNTTNLNNINHQLNNQLINKTTTTNQVPIVQCESQQTKKLTKFNIESICENELKQESINNKETSKSNLADLVDQQQINRTIESNSPANSESNSNNSSSYKYMKLKKSWLNSFENQNNVTDQATNQINNMVVKSEPQNESSLDLLAEASSLKQRSDSVKQETDLKCKEEFKFKFNDNANKSTAHVNHQLLDETDEEDIKLKIDEDDNTSVSSNNESNSESDTEQSNSKVSTDKRRTNSKLPRSTTVGRKCANGGRINRRSKDEDEASHSKADDSADSPTNFSTTTASKRSKTTTATNRIAKRLNKSVRSAVQDNSSQFSNCSSANSINSERESLTRNSTKSSLKGSLKNNAIVQQLEQQQTSSSNLFCNLPISQLKKTGQSFLQEKSCVEVAPKLDKCRECFLFQNQNQNRKKEVQPSNIFCRFYAFRKLHYDKNELKSAGFSDSKDADKEETNFWLPGPNKFINLSFDEAKFILKHAGDQLCDLINEELRAMRMHCGSDQSIRWKRVVQGVREMCDVCETTLFNVHWTCLECGFCVCIECYVGRLNCDGSPNNTALVNNSSLSLNADDSSNSLVNVSNTPATVERIEHLNDRDTYNWLLCKNDKNKNDPPPHEQSKLMLTQIAPGNVFYTIARKLHSTRNKLGVKCNSNSCKDGTSALNGLLQNLDDPDDESIATTTVNSTIIEQQPTDVLTNSNNRPHNKENKDLNSKRNSKSNSINSSLSLTVEEDKRKSMEFFGRDRKSNNVNKEPPRVCNFEDTIKEHPHTPHQWLCEGRLLWFKDSELDDENLPLFKEQWIRGQPLIVSGVTDKLSSDLWNANQLSSKMTKSSSTSSKGNTNNIMFNCKTNEAVKITLSRFWEGYQIVGRRVKEGGTNGQPLCLKLKDWPPGDDFSELLPDQFNEFFANIPIPSYTKREGSCNLAARLPTSFVKPDLGPKMYTAYGCDVSLPDIGTTNLHLDISDAVNVLVYVTVAKCSSKDGNKDLEEEQFEFLDSLEDIDRKTKERIRSRKSDIGALWHIYEAKDADTIRTYLKGKVGERKRQIATSGDPIHDQSYYLTVKMRKELKEQHGVVGYSIVQLLGDAIFIPAGAPHQVRNIHSAIKLACDFVSPENVNHCFDLTGQFRMLSSLHSNHEDKLQIKNIIYHAVKDSLTVCEQTNENSAQDLVNRAVEQFDQDSQLDSVLNEESNKRDALKSANLNDGTATNKLANETSPNGKRSKGLNVNERSKRNKLIENIVVQQASTNDLNNNTNSSPTKRKRDESADAAKTMKKNRKDHKTLKMK